MEVDLGAGSATFTLNVFETRDFHDFLNSLKHGPSDLVIVSFKVQWGGKVQRSQRQDAANGLRGEFVETRATMEWFASEKDFNLASAPADTSTSVVAVLGEEHNGRFF